VERKREGTGKERGAKAGEAKGGGQERKGQKGRGEEGKGDKAPSIEISGYATDQILVRSGDIRRRNLKSSKIGPNFACLWPLKFFLERTHRNFGPGLLNRIHFPTWFKISRRSANGAWRSCG